MSLDRIVCPGCDQANTHRSHCAVHQCGWLVCLGCKAIYTKRPPVRWVQM